METITRQWGEGTPKMPTTKGEMVKILKRFGIRTGEKDGITYGIKHLKIEDIANIFWDFAINFDPTEVRTFSTGDALHFKTWLDSQAIAEVFGD